MIPPQYWQREGRNKWLRQSNKMRKLRGFPYHAGLFPTGQHKLLPNTCCCARAILTKGAHYRAVTTI